MKTQLAVSRIAWRPCGQLRPAKPGTGSGKRRGGGGREGERESFMIGLEIGLMRAETGATREGGLRRVFIINNTKRVHYERLGGPCE